MRLRVSRVHSDDEIPTENSGTTFAYAAIIMSQSKSEAMEVCPTDVARAPVELAWEHFTNPSLLGWVDAKLVDAPARPVAVGDRLLFKADFGLRVTWSILAIEPHRQVELDIGLPFGMANRQTTVFSRIDAHSCRITFS